MNIEGCVFFEVMDGEKDTRHKKKTQVKNWIGEKRHKLSKKRYRLSKKYKLEKAKRIWQKIKGNIGYIV